MNDSKTETLVILILGATILFGLFAIAALEWTGKNGAATLVSIVTTALGILCPSPLKPNGAEKQANRIDADSVTVQQTASTEGDKS